MSGRSAVGLEEVECFVVGTAGEEVFEAWGQRAVILMMPLRDLLGDGFQGIQMGLGVAVAERVVGDDFDAALK